MFSLQKLIITLLNIPSTMTISHDYDDYMMLNHIVLIMSHDLYLQRLINTFMHSNFAGEAAQPSA